MTAPDSATILATIREAAELCRPDVVLVHPDDVDRVRAAHEQRRATDLFAPPLQIDPSPFVAPGTAVLIPGRYAPAHLEGPE